MLHFHESHVWQKVFSENIFSAWCVNILRRLIITVEILSFTYCYYCNSFEHPIIKKKYSLYFFLERQKWVRTSKHKKRKKRKKKLYPFRLVLWKWFPKNIQEIHTKIFFTKMTLLCNFTETALCHRCFFLISQIFPKQFFLRAPPNTCFWNKSLLLFYGSL